MSVQRKILKLSGVIAMSLLSCSLKPAFAVTVPDPMLDTQPAATQHEDSIVFAGGCFWGIQAVFEHVKGVKSAISGYAGGTSDTARYEIVSSGQTGHAESVKVVYDPSQVSLGQLLKVFFSVAHDPTQLNRQSPDVGTQYRSAVFTNDDRQTKIVEAYITQIDQAKVFEKPIMTKIEPLKGFYAAEDYHQDYYRTHPYSPYIMINDAPKVAALEKELPNLFVKR